MEEQSQKECKTKKCCVKCIIIVIVCSLLCFFLGYYAGSRSLAKISGAVINKPFTPNKIPKVTIPSQVKSIKSLQRNNFPNVQKAPISKISGVQHPNVQKAPTIKTPNIQPPKVNIPNEIKEKAAAQAKSNNTQKK